MSNVPRNKLLAAVHIAKKELAIGDDAWGDLVERVAGERSCGLLDDAGLVKVRDEMARIGARFERKTAGRNGPAPFVKAKKPYARKIYALWGELKKRAALENPSKQALRAFCAKMAETGDATTDPDFLTSAQGNKVIEALKAMIRRAPEPPEDRRA